jgi:hypothetical protein
MELVALKTEPPSRMLSAPSPDVPTEMSPAQSQSALEPVTVTSPVLPLA